MATQPFWYEDIQADYVQVGTKAVEAIYRGSTLLWEIERTELSGQADIAADLSAQAEIDFSFEIPQVAIGEIAADTTAAGGVRYALAVSQVSHSAIAAAITASSAKTQTVPKNIQATQSASIAALLAAEGWVYIGVAQVVELSASATIEAGVLAAGDIELGIADFSFYETATAQIDSELAAAGALQINTEYNGIYVGTQQIGNVFQGTTPIEWVFLGNRVVFGPLFSSLATETGAVLVTESNSRLVI
jgi:hypothetical protein